VRKALPLLSVLPVLLVPLALPPPLLHLALLLKDDLLVVVAEAPVVDVEVLLALADVLPEKRGLPNLHLKEVSKELPQLLAALALLALLLKTRLTASLPPPHCSLPTCHSPSLTPSSPRSSGTRSWLSSLLTSL